MSPCWNLTPVHPAVIPVGLEPTELRGENPATLPFVHGTVLDVGFEPTISWLRARRLNRLSSRALDVHVPRRNFEIRTHRLKVGCSSSELARRRANEIRTRGFLIMSEVPYRLGHRAVGRKGIEPFASAL